MSYTINFKEDLYRIDFVRGLETVVWKNPKTQKKEEKDVITTNCVISQVGKDKTYRVEVSGKSQQSAEEMLNYSLGNCYALYRALENYPRENFKKCVFYNWMKKIRNTKSFQGDKKFKEAVERFQVWVNGGNPPGGVIQ